jgi:hypothetical protein
MLRWLVLIASTVLVLVYTVNRDICFERAYTGDLRNRVTGSRMIKDGRSPYFYKWKTGDGLRYYDPGNFDSVRPSNMTSTPFLYRLLSPIVEMPQSKISEWWLAIEYLMLAGLTLFAFFQAQTTLQKQLVLLVFLLVLLTNGWKEHVAHGQTYLCVPFFAMLFLAFREINGHSARAMLAGAAAACLILIRFNTILFFVPFLFMTRRHNRTWLAWFCIPMVLFACWTLTSPHERSLWQDYFNNVKEATKINQNLHPALLHNTPDPLFPLWEGIDTAEALRYTKAAPAKIYSENGNFFVLFTHIFHRDLSVTTLGLLSLLLIVTLVLLFYFRRRPPGRQDMPKAAIFGSCLFMIADLFSPIYRHQYYTVQWILPLMLAASAFSFRARGWYALLLAGLLLNCIHLPFIKMENTIGEYLFLLVLLALVLTSGWSATPGPLLAGLSTAGQPDKQQPASIPEST